MPVTPETNQELPLEEWLGPLEASQRMGVSLASVHVWLRLGQLPGVKVGRVWRIDPAVADEIRRKRDAGLQVPPRPPDVPPRHDQPVQFKSLPIQEELAKRVTAGRSAGRTAIRELARLIYLRQVALRRVRLAPEQARLLVDACRDLAFDEHTWRNLLSDLEDRARTNGFASRGLAELVQALRPLGLAETLALVDAVERYWLLPPDRPADERLVEVGLLRAS